MAVAFDAKGSVFTGAATTSFTNTSLTIGAISNGVLVLAVQFGAAITSPVVKWDSTGTFQTMTLIGSKAATDAGQAYLFGLIAPHTGNKTLSVSWTGSASYCGNMASFSGADQALFSTTFKNLATNASSTTATGSYPSPSGLSITTVSGDMAIMSVASLNQGWDTAAGLGTEIEADNTNVSGAARYLAAVGASTALAADGIFSGTNPCCAAGCAIAQVSADVLRAQAWL